MEKIYQLKIELADSDPKIWRRIQVSTEMSFSDLHDIIQLSMGWEDDHLYEFEVKKVRVFDFQEAFDDGENPAERDSMDTFLDDLLNKVNTKFTYIYDFGDHWEHTIQLEKIFPEEEGNTYPICLEGEGACPPEDCGGIWRYQDMVKIMADKDHPEYDDIADWMGEDWEPTPFNCEGVNVLLKNYAEEWDEIYDELDELDGSSEDGDLEFEDFEDGLHGEDEVNEYEESKKFSSPEDMLQDEHELLGMRLWLDLALEEKKSIPNQTYKRLHKSGLDDQSTKNLMLEALSIEWLYDLKYGTDHLEARFEYNLHQLPEPPQELPRLKDALDVLNNCMKGVPFTAIEYLQNDTSEEATSAILNALRNHSDHQYCWEDCTFAPLWYAFAAEAHLCEALIDPVIQLYESSHRDSDWLFEQGQYLIGKLAQQYPELTAQKVLEAMEQDVDKGTKQAIFFLFDAFYFCDIDKCKTRLLTLLERENISWFEPLAATFADLQIKEGLPILRQKLKKLQTNVKKDLQYTHAVVEIKEAIDILEGKMTLDPELIKPLSLTRQTSWKHELIAREHVFYGDDYYTNDYSSSNPFEQNFPKPTEWPQFSNTQPLIKEKTPGRNEPCHCGSGKKYKKCCMDKEL